MGEVVQVHVGQCGIRLGASFWQQLCADHRVSDAGCLLEESVKSSFGLHRYFQEEQRTCHPRSILVDLSSQALDSLQGTSQSRLFTPDQYSCDSCGSQNLFALGNRSDMSDSAIEAFRRQAEPCDFLTDLHFTMGIGGGTGAGLGSKLLTELRTEYMQTYISAFAVVPAAVSDIVVEPYNCVLAFQYLMDSADMTVIADNEALSSHLGNSQASIPALNTAFAGAMNTLTCGTRYPGYLNGSSLRKLSTSLMPFIRLRCFTLAHCPMPLDLSSATLDASLFSKNSCLASVETRAKGIIGASVVFRGEISTYEAETALGEYQRGKGWNRKLADHISLSYCSFLPPKSPSKVAVLVNSAGICPPLTQTLRAYQRLFQRKAFLRPYLEAGMEEMEFFDAESHYQDIISEYSMWDDEAWGNIEDIEEEEME